MTRYIVERRDAFGVEPICRTLGVPVSTHYARRSRKPSARELADRELLLQIEAARTGRRKVYGARKTWKELKRREVEVGRDQVARVTREHGLVGKLRGSKKRTTIPDEAAAEGARDLLQRDFTAMRPNEKWVADLTYVRTGNGFVYLAFILDCYSRRIVGWQLATRMRAELVVDALEMANGLRRPSTTMRWPRRGSRPSRASSSTAAASPRSSTPNTRPSTGSASTTMKDSTKHSTTSRPPSARPSTTD